MRRRAAEAFALLALAVAALAPSPSRGCVGPLHSVPARSTEAFRRAMDSLGLPIDVFRDPALPVPEGWDPAASWPSTWAILRPSCERMPACGELFDAVFALEGEPGLTRASHRARVDAWAKRWMPEGARLLWPESFRAALTELRADFPDQDLEFELFPNGVLNHTAYHGLLLRGYLPIANHHDLVTHALSHAIPEVRRATLAISRQFDRLNRLRTPDRERGWSSVPPALAPLERRLVWLWGLAQEKLFLLNPADSRGGPPRLLLLGAYGSLAGWAFGPAIGPAEREWLRSRLDPLDPDPRFDEARGRFAAIADATLARDPAGTPFEARWESLGAALGRDPAWSGLLARGGLLEIVRDDLSAISRALDAWGE